MNLIKSISLLTTFMLMVSSLMNAQTVSVDNQITSMLKEFYSSYIMETSKFPTNTSKILTIKRRYCTLKLLAKIKREKLDFDPILNAQDSDEESIKSLTINKEKQNIYIVSYSAPDGEIIKIRLLIVKDNNQFKIGSILPLLEFFSGTPSPTN